MTEPTIPPFDKQFDAYEAEMQKMLSETDRLLTQVTTQQSQLGKNRLVLIGRLEAVKRVREMATVATAKPSCEAPPSVP